MNLAPDFVRGHVREVFPSRELAIAAARSAVAQDEQHRARVVWVCRGGESAGVVVPDRYVVGLLHRRMPGCEPGVRVHTEQWAGGAL